MFEYVKGNIVTGNYEIFCQQVNCQHKMGAGLAKQIRNAYPEVYKEYIRVENPMLGYILPVFTTDGRICINMFAQDRYGNDDSCYTDYVAFKNCLNAIVGFISDHHIHEDIPIAFPYGIGCGYGGGSWIIIQDLIKEFSEKIPQKVIVVMK